MNIAEILKNVPKGTKLYSPAFGECELEAVYLNSCYPIKVTTKQSTYRFTSEGLLYNNERNGECMLFPSKENRDWSKFTTCPFKDGDIIAKTYSDGTKCIAIFSHIGGIKPEVVNYHCYVSGYKKTLVVEESYDIGLCTEYKLASEKEREILFKSLKENGYYWDTCTKIVKPLYLKFKVGDTIHKEGYPNYTIIAIEEDRYRMKNDFFLRFVDQHEWEVVKFNINELKPFDKVLVRDTEVAYWSADFYSHYRNNVSNYHYRCISNHYNQCIPYNKETKYLVGTKKECPNYYKTWE